MQEKELARSQAYTGKIIITILLVICILTALTTIYTSYSSYCDSYLYHQHYRSCYSSSKYVNNPDYLVCSYSEYSTPAEYAWAMGSEDYIETALIYIGGPILFAVILRLLLSTFGMVITDKRISGWSVLQLWRTDLPLDMIQSVSLVGFTGIFVRTAGGGILLFMIKNRKELHEVLCQVMIRRQSCMPLNWPSHANETITKTPQPTATDKTLERELYELKEKLDYGNISQEEYEIRRKALLGE